MRFLQIQEQLLSCNDVDLPTPKQREAAALEAWQDELRRIGFLVGAEQESRSKEIILAPEDFIKFLDDASFCPGFSVELYKSKFGAPFDRLFCRGPSIVEISP